MKVGDKIKDNDPRVVGRVLTITAIGVESVLAEGRSGNEVKISTKRIFSDGKKRRSGFDLLKQEDAE